MKDSLGHHNHLDIEYDVISEAEAKAALSAGKKSSFMKPPMNINGEVVFD